MKRDFEIVDGIYLVQSSHELDRHINFNFLGLNYSVESRTLLLSWRRSDGEWVAPGYGSKKGIEKAILIPGISGKYKMAY